MNKKLLLIAGIVISTAGVYSSSAIAATTTGSSTARVVQALTINSANTLAFGDILSGTVGTVILDTGNGVTGTVGTAGTGTRTSGSFTLAGAADAVYTVSLDASTTISNGTTTLNVTSINHDGGLLTTRTLDNLGDDTLSIGGTLTVTTGATTGPYSGTYSITVDYQ